MISDDNRLPKTVAGLFGVAGSLYARRAPLYLTLALIAFVVQFVVDLMLSKDTGLSIGLSIVIDAYLVAAVSIGVAFDLAAKPADWSTVLLAASERWGVVTVVGLVYQVVVVYLEPNVIGSPDDTGYGFLSLPIIVFWGAISLSGVVAAIEPTKRQLLLPLLALGKGLAVGLRWANVGRLVLLSLILVLPLFVEEGLMSLLLARNLPNAQFWGNVPFDALIVGPLQALATVFYVDFLRKARS